MINQVCLTKSAKAAGWAAKLSPALLDSIIRKLPKSANANVLVGYDTSDDAAVYRMSNELALAQTVDLWRLVADDPFIYGRIASANSLSDVFAIRWTAHLRTGPEILKSAPFEQARTIPDACESCEFRNTCQGVVLDESACKERYCSLTFIVRSFRGDRPRLMAATRDLPTLSSSCTTVVIAAENRN